jgi:hypothetical protein
MGRFHPPAGLFVRAAAVGLASAALVAACSRPRSPPKPAAAPPPPAASTSAAPLPSPVLTRADLIAAAAAARDAYARGAPYPEANTDLVGRRFTLRLPFGCTDATSDADDARIEADATKKSLTLAARPQVWTGQPWLSPIVGPSPPVEAVEGFWIRRPWTTSELCPPTPAALPAPPAPTGKPLAGKAPTGKPPTGGAAPAPPAPPAASAETLGLVRIYRAGDSRLKRHAHQPYRVVLKLTDSRIPLDRRFWLVLDGRVASLEGGEGKGQPIRCQAATAQVLPRCLIGMELDHVAVEAQATGERLAEWAG